ncbi:MAG: tRNA pseudouridine(55) synthase TruB [Alphaproteobacteria bacterium]|nr:MAG: tRNA pseudouridine(55) synthase TruB [Alphaproteobacteria bacterium]
MVRGRNKGRKVHGWIVLDKPPTMTSTQAVARVKRAFNAQKAGHAGTLDPLASGCLPIALGEATKTVSYVMNGRKIYRFSVRWGEERETDDSEGKVTASSDRRPDAAEITALLAHFTGTIMQVPPAYSAVKVAGERAYDLARSGDPVTLDARQIVVHRLELADCPDADTAVFVAECGKGTYVRALARDMGRMLGTYGHVVALRRLSVGPFGDGDMISLELLAQMSHNAPASGHDSLMEALKPVITALDDIPALAVSEQDAARLRRGQALFLKGRDAPVITGPAYAVSGDVPVALGEVVKGAFNPRRVFNLSGDPWVAGTNDKRIIDVDYS